MQAVVQQFVAELLRENLVVGEEAKGAESPWNQPMPAQAGYQTQRPGFVPPSLHKYVDMQELLLLDPIHEVDETGWPSIKPDTPATDH